MIGLASFSVPFLPMISKEDNNNHGDFMWQIPLISWCVIFTPICFLMAEYFDRTCVKRNKTRESRQRPGSVALER